MGSGTGRLSAGILYGNDAKDEWESLDLFEVEPFVDPQWGTVSPAEAHALKKGKWRHISLPNGEVLDIQILFRAEEGQLAVHVKQGSEPVAQLLCEGAPSMIFLTRGGATVNIQFYDGVV